MSTFHITRTATIGHIAPAWSRPVGLDAYDLVLDLTPPCSVRIGVPPGTPAPVAGVDLLDADDGVLTFERVDSANTIGVCTVAGSSPVTFTVDRWMGTSSGREDIEGDDL